MPCYLKLASADSIIIRYFGKNIKVHIGAHALSLIGILFTKESTLRTTWRRARSFRHSHSAGWMDLRNKALIKDVIIEIDQLLKGLLLLLLLWREEAIHWATI